MNTSNLNAGTDTISSIAYLDWRSIVKEDWRLMIVSAIVSFFLASLITSGAPDGLIPELSVPFGYSGDSIFHAWMASRVDEGWIFDNPRSGYPFGSKFLDYPGSDAGNHLVIKLISGLAGGWVGGLNLYFLLGFPVCFIASYIAARAFGLNRRFAMTVALLYTLTPFHFLRLEYQHLFYTWYFSVPVFFYLALGVYRSAKQPPAENLSLRMARGILSTVGLFIISSFGVYYAVFGVIIIGLAGVLNWAKSKNLRGMKRSFLLCFAIGAGVALNVAPNAINALNNGVNKEVAQRSPGQSEHLGFKLMQLMLPRLDHRSSALANLTRTYNNGSPLINENATATLGMIGAGGLVLTFLFLLFRPTGRADDERLRLVAAITFVLFMFGTIGGLGTVFAWFISPSIRGWNRISVFIAFSTVLFTFIALQILLKAKAAHFSRYVTAIAAVALLLGFFDQTIPVCKSCYLQRKSEFENDKNFVQSIERALPSGAAVYQLPYIGFPEEPPLNHMISYQALAGAIHSQDLHWSFGGMKGRPGDLFYRSLANAPLSRQLEVVRRLGFDGIYIDRRGYEDNGNAVIEELTQLLHMQPTLEHASKKIVFFKLDERSHPPISGMTPKQIMAQAHYFGDASGVRYRGDLASGIDLSKPSLPDFIASISGLSSVEPWGRWSDQGKITFEFVQSLPQRFTLVLKAHAFASNASKPTKVEIGSHTYDVQVTAGDSEIRLDVDLQGENTDRITFIPPEPISPHEVDKNNGDRRTIAIGFVSMSIDTQ